MLILIRLQNYFRRSREATYAGRSGARFYGNSTRPNALSNITRLLNLRAKMQFYAGQRTSGAFEKRHLTTNGIESRYEPWNTRTFRPN